MIKINITSDDGVSKMELSNVLIKLFKKYKLKFNSGIDVDKKNKPMLIEIDNTNKGYKNLVADIKAILGDK